MTIETIDLENLPAYLLDETWKDTFKLSPPRKRTFDLGWESESRIKRSKSLADMAGTRTKKKEVFRYSDMIWDEEMANVGSLTEETKLAATEESRFTIDLTKEEVLEYLDHLEQAPVPGTTDQASTSESRGVQTEIPHTAVVDQNVLSQDSNFAATSETRGTQSENTNNSTFESHGIQTEIPLPAVLPEDSNLIVNVENCGTQTENLNNSTFESHGVQTDTSHPATFESRHVQTEAAIAHAIVAPQILPENSTRQSSISNPPSTDISEASQKPVFGFSTITYVDPSERFVKTKQERTLLWATTERSVKPYVTWDERAFAEVTARYALFCGDGIQKKEKQQKDNLLHVAKVLKFFRLKYTFPPEILCRRRRQRIWRIFSTTGNFKSALQLRLDTYLEDRSIYSWGGRHLVATVAQRMLSAGEKPALAIHLLWTYETMYAQLAKKWPEIYVPAGFATRAGGTRHSCVAALEALVLATTDGPVDEKYTSSGQRYSGREDMLLDGRRNNLKGESRLFSNFLNEMRTFVGIQINAAPPGSYRRDLVEIAYASLVEEYVDKHPGSLTTLISYIKKFSADWDDFFLKEITKTIGDNFDTWAKAISEPYSDIPDGQLKTSFVVSQDPRTPDQYPDIYSPFQLCWQSIMHGVRRANVNHLEVVKWERGPQGPKPERHNSSQIAP